MGSLDAELMGAKTEGRLPARSRAVLDDSGIRRFAWAARRRYHANAAASVGFAEIAAAVLRRASNAGRIVAVIVVVGRAGFERKGGAATMVDPDAAIVEGPGIVLCTGRTAALANHGDSAVGFGDYGAYRLRKSW